VAAHWFADNVRGNPGGTAWDVYFLYGPQSRWGTAPSGLIASDSPVVANLDSLKAHLSAS
jgi:hypothetical protein